MKSRLLKKLIAYGFFPLTILFFLASPILGINVAEASSGCDLAPGAFHIGQCIGTGLAYAFTGINAILGLILYVIGRLLDFAISFSINPSGDLYRSETVSAAWNLLRDIINMSFIFLLLYIAIGTVLNIGNINWKKQVTQIIVAAILVNFSLFITRVVIDAGNILANSFYTEITSCETTPCPDGEGNARENVGISERFMNALGIATITDLRTGNVDTGTMEGWEGVASALMEGLVILITMWVFLTAAILFIARTFALVFILALSPIGIAGANLPLLSGPAKKWREELFKQSMLGVVFLFFVFIILTFAYTEREVLLAESTGINEVGEKYLAAGLGRSTDGTGAESLIIMYLFVTAALIMALRLTKNISGQMGSFMDGAIKGAVGLGLGVATGGAALVGRQTLGRAAAAYVSSDAGKKLKTAAEGGDRGAVRKYNALQATAKGSMDVRNSKFGGAVTERATKLGGVAGLNASLGSKIGKGGRVKRNEEIAEKREKQLEVLSPEAKRKRADDIESRTKGRIPGLGRGAHKETAKRLRKGADKQETSKEEREKRVERSAGNIRSNENNEDEVKEILGKLKSNELRDLPPDVLKKPNVIKQLKVGDLEALKGHLNRADLSEIVQSPYLDDDKVKAWVNDPEKGYQ